MAEPCFDAFLLLQDQSRKAIAPGVITQATTRNAGRTPAPQNYKGVHMVDNSGQAFPKAIPGSDGMTLRDYFAGEALPHALKTEMTGCEYAERVAAYSYWIADAMLAERAK